MFKWLFSKRGPATAEQSKPEAPPAAPVAQSQPQEQAVAAPPVAAAAPPPAAPASLHAAAPPSAPAVIEQPPAAQAAPPLAITTPAAGFTLPARTVSELSESDDMEPTIGLDAVAISPPRLDGGKVVRIQAGGRRVMVRFADTHHVRAYSRRSDGTYRLEGAPKMSPSRLILGATV
jgi:hypothetical protein